MNTIGRSIVGLCALAGVIWLANASFWVGAGSQGPRLIAHRGVHHTYAGSERDTDTCRAAQVAPIQHDLIENTLPSMAAAFAYGADVVEIDVHLTEDKIFAVFHDWELDCQTDGTGVTEEQVFEDLRDLDLGYGITEGDGTYPLRGKGKGMMPRLREVLTADVDGLYLVNFKSRRVEEGVMFGIMADDPIYHAKVFGVYGGAEPTHAAMEATGLRGFDKDILKTCLTDYMMFGWTGYVPTSCRNRLIGVPQNYARFFWGWPHRFVKRMNDAGTDVILFGPYYGGGFTSGIDDLDQLARVPEGFGGYVWTNRIEVIGPALKGLSRQ